MEKIKCCKCGRFVRLEETAGAHPVTKVPLTLEELEGYDGEELRICFDCL